MVKKITIFAHFFLILCITSACGYSLQGTKADGINSRRSVLGNGEKTIAITKVEQSSLVPWLPYELRNLLYTEMNMRKLAKWAPENDADDADFQMEANLSSFESRAYISGSHDETLLSVVSARLSVDIYDANRALVWSSGSVTYSERYENVQEEEAVEEILRELVYIVYDRMQGEF